MAKLLPDGPIDTMGLRAAYLGMPEQLAATAAIGPVDGLPAPTEIDHVVVVAPGAARTAGDIVRLLAAPVATVPVLTHPGPDLPVFVAARTLVVVAGEALDAPAVRTARTAAEQRGAHTVVVVPEEPVPVGRAAVAGLTARLLAVLGQLRQYPDTESAVSAAVAQLTRRRDELSGAASPMARLARRIGRTLPLVYGAEPLTGVVARQWKQQVNLDAKAASFAGSLPGIGWDEVSGWGQHGDMTRQVFSLVTLRCDHEPPGAGAAMDAVVELLDEVVHDHHEVRAEGNGPLAQVLDLVLQGCLLGWHLAQELEIDPGPTAAVS